MLGISAGLARSLSYSVRVLVEREHAAGHRVAGGVVAADDQQDQVAEVLLRRHVPRGLAVGQHRDQVVARLGVDALVPQPREVLEALQQLGAAAASGARTDADVGLGGGHVGPVASACGGPRTGSRTASRASAWSARSTPCRPSRRSRRAAARRGCWPARSRISAFDLGQVRRRDDRAHGLALHVVLRRVHRDEHRQPLVIVRRVAIVMPPVGREDARGGCRRT